MKFDDLDAKMRTFETSHDYCVPQGVHMVARLDGRGFTKLTKELLIQHGHGVLLDVPFDTHFHGVMVSTVKSLMSTAGFNIIYGYTESDEISLLFHPEENTFGRKMRKLNSLLAGEASVHFSRTLANPGVFDCRISQLPTEDLVVDYFRWRQEDASRNALYAHCHYALLKKGFSPSSTSQALHGKRTEEKVAMLAGFGIDYNTLSLWQKRGTGAYWEETERLGLDLLTNQEVSVSRRTLTHNEELPVRDEYSAFIRSILEATRETKE